MVIVSLKINNIEDKEVDIIDYFCEYLIDIIQTKLNTPKLKNKLDVRIPYLYTLPWVKWIKKDISSDDIIERFYTSLSYTVKKDYYIDIFVNDTHPLKNTITPFISIVKWFNNGDNNITGLNYIEQMHRQLNTKYVNEIWSISILSALGYKPSSNVYTF